MSIRVRDRALTASISAGRRCPVVLHPQLVQMVLHRSQQVLDRDQREILTVHPLELGQIEHRGLLLDPLEGEELDHLRLGQDLPVATRRPTQEGEEVAHRERQDAQVAIVAHRRRAMTLGELLPVGAQDHRHMGEGGDRLTQGAVDRDLLRGVGDVVITPDHVGDLHRDVVRHHGEVVDRAPVAPQDDEVVEVATLKADPLVHRVVPGDLLLRHPEPKAKRASFREPGLNLLLAQPAAATIIAEGSPGLVGPRALRIQLLLGAETPIRLIPRQHRLGVGPMAVAVTALEERPLVPGNPQPGEAVENHLGVRLGAPLLVGVLDPEDEGAAGVPGEQPIEQRRAGAADVEIAGGGGSEADAGGHRCQVLGQVSGVSLRGSEATEAISPAVRVHEAGSSKGKARDCHGPFARAAHSGGLAMTLLTPDP